MVGREGIHRTDREWEDRGVGKNASPDKTGEALLQVCEYMQESNFAEGKLDEGWNQAHWIWGMWVTWVDSEFQD